jgi:hypothetical protein
MYKNALNHNFQGRKPSKTHVSAAAKRLAKQGADYITITWGENWIDLAFDPIWGWSGNGWIKDIDAHYVARDINHVGA